jgi:hypothetical protein
VLGLRSFSIFTFELAGTKLSRGCALVPLSGRPKLLRFFKKYGVRHEEARVWM